jgi:hypothetical protein
MLVYHEAVIYPNQPVAWDDELQVVAVGCPDWFDQWADAAGLPVTKLHDCELLRSGRWRTPDKSVLLVLENNRVCGKEFSAVEQLADEHQARVLVLRADWFGKLQSTERSVVIRPKRLVGPLSDWCRQRWSTTPIFSSCAAPWAEEADRQMWIAGPDGPLVESIRCRREGAGTLQVVLSYLPWQEQLGRCEMADALLLRVLREAAKL